MYRNDFCAVIFDLDGTILDTLEDIAVGTNHVLRLAGFPTHPIEAYRYFVGNGVDMLIRRALPAEISAQLPPPSAEQEGEACHIFQRLKAELAEYHKKNGEGFFTRPFSGISALFQELQKRQIPLAIFSNKPEERVLRSIPHSFPHISFFRILGAREGFPLKPDPTVVLSVARDANLTPEKIIYLGDSDVDMQTAKNAGMYAVGAGWGYRGEKELRQAGANLVIKEPAELLDLFDLPAKS